MSDALFLASLALVAGSIVGGVFAVALCRARQTLAVERATSELAVELASVRERANRALEIEAELTATKHAAQVSQADVLRLSKLEVEKNQLLRSTEEILSDARARLRSSEELAASCSAELTMFKQRAATLEAEVSRVPALEARLKQVDDLNDAVAREITLLRESIGRASAELKAERDLASTAQRELDAARAELATMREVASQLSVDKMDLATRLDAERQQAAEKLQLLNDAKQSLSDQFKALANDILEEKSRRFAEQNQTNLGQLLDPLKTKLGEFQAKVETVYVDESKDRTALKEQVQQLMALNQALSSDAKNLTQALKGSNKAQGNYGELVLERVLESSGLRKGEEYETQSTHTREDGTRAQPDVIIRLPEDRNLVVDSKLSLLAYEQSVSAECESDREAAIARHIASVRAHIKGLSEKNYHALYQLKSLDFVLMFVPIEPAFMLAVTQDRDLFMEAWSKNVLLVSPSTLMFVVRRRSPGKDSATVHDFVVRIPSGLTKEFAVERKLIIAELRRVVEFGSLAMNRHEVFKVLRPVLDEYDLHHHFA